MGVRILIKSLLCVINKFFFLIRFSSKIQGLGLYAARDMERHTMIIEYIGEVIRSEVSEIREKQYEARVSYHFKYIRY